MEATPQVSAEFSYESKGSRRPTEYADPISCPPYSWHSKCSMVYKANESAELSSRQVQHPPCQDPPEHSKDIQRSAPRPLHEPSLATALCAIVHITTWSSHALRSVLFRRLQEDIGQTVLAPCEMMDLRLARPGWVVKEDVNFLTKDRHHPLLQICQRHHLASLQ